MTVISAMKTRIEDLCKEKGLTLYRLQQLSGVGSASLVRITSNSGNSSNIVTVARIAFAFGMTISEFFDSPLFDEENLKL